MTAEPMYEGYNIFVRWTKGTYAYPYISRITGPHPQFHFTRIFLRLCRPTRSGGGWHYEIDLFDEGVYEVGIKRWNSETKELLSREVFWFILFDGDIMDISKEEVLEALNDLQAFFWAS